MIKTKLDWKGRAYESKKAYHCETCNGNQIINPTYFVAFYLSSFYLNTLGNYPDESIVSEAFHAARSARFEHGEQGR